MSDIVMIHCIHCGECKWDRGTGKICPCCGRVLPSERFPVNHKLHPAKCDGYAVGWPIGPVASKGC